MKDLRTHTRQVSANGLLTRAARSRWTLASLVLLPLWGLSAPGCGDDEGTGAALTGPATSAATTTGSGGGGGGNTAGPAELAFRAVEANIVSTCGACHTAGSNTGFLGDPANEDVYDVIKAWPDFVVKEVSTSLLLVFPVDGSSHPGTALDGALRDGVETWLDEEAKTLPGGGGGGTPGVAPTYLSVPGFNALYLDGLGDQYRGMAVTFSAKSVAMGLELSNLKVYPTTQMGLKFMRPVFTLHPLSNPAGDEDPNDPFVDVDIEVPAGTVATLAPDTVVLEGWDADVRIGLKFDMISILGGGGGTVCGDLQSFMNNALAAFDANCSTCHSGQGAGVNSYDLSGLNNDAGPACGQVLNRVDLQTPADSQIFLVTDPNGNAAHPFKFDGMAGDHTTFVDAVTPWIQAEAAAATP